MTRTLKIQGAIGRLIGAEKGKSKLDLIRYSSIFLLVFLFIISFRSSFMIKRRTQVVHVTFIYKYSCTIVFENIRLLKTFETLNCFFRILRVKHKVGEATLVGVKFKFDLFPNFLSP